MIKKVRAVNIKLAENLDLDLPARVVLTGENGAGKSTVIQAVLLAITGSLPGIATKDIFKLARRGENVNNMLAGLELDNGFTFSRQWTRKEFFFKLGGQQEISIEDIQEEVKKVMARVNIPQAQKELDRLAESIKERWTGNLESLLDWLAQEQSAATRDVDLSRKAAQKLSEIKARRQTVAGRLDQLKAELEQAREELSQVRENLSKNDYLREAITNRDEKIEAIQSQISWLNKEQNDLPDPMHKAQEITNLGLEFLKVEKHYEEEIKNLSEQIKTTEDETIKAQADMIRAKDQLSAALGEKGLLDRLGDSELKAKLSKPSQGVISQLRKQSEADLGPLHKAVAEAEKKWSAATKKVAKLQADLENLVREAEKIAADLNSRIAVATDWIELISNRLPEIEQERQELSRELKELREKRLEEPQPDDELQALKSGLEERISILPDGRFVDFDSLSTGERTLLLAAMVGVICKHSAAPLKLLCLDNIEVISARYESAFYDGLSKIADFCGIDNLIVATSKELLPDKNLSGMEVITFPLVAEYAAK